MSTASKDTRSFNEHDVKDALCKFFKQEGLEVSTKRVKSVDSSYPLDDTEFRKAKFVEMPTSVEELLIKGDLS